MELATFTPNLNLQLPIEVAKHFLPSDRFMVWLDGDTLVLKKVVPSITRRLEGVPRGNPMPMSLDEINDVVHSVRHREGD